MATSDHLSIRHPTKGHRQLFALIMTAMSFFISVINVKHQLIYTPTPLSVILDSLLFNLVWYGVVVWCDVVWCGVVWCDVVWYGKEISFRLWIPLA